MVAMVGKVFSDSTQVCKSKASSLFSQNKHNVTKEPLWPDGCHNLSWVHERLTGTGPVTSSKPDNAENRNLKIEAIHEDTAFVALLRACAEKKDLCRGAILHADVLKRGLLERSSYVEGALVHMYAKCGALAKAQDLLVGLPVRDVYSWTQVMMGYAQKGQGHDALNCFEQMRHEGVSPDAVTFSCILKACGSIG
eukprot:c24122_g15_i1 orf=170-754(+)